MPQTFLIYCSFDFLCLILQTLYSLKFSICQHNTSFSASLFTLRRPCKSRVFRIRQLVWQLNASWDILFMTVLNTMDPHCSKVLHFLHGSLLSTLLLRISQEIGACWMKLIIHIAAFKHFLMPFSLTTCQKC